jgi:pimeloyl-ACP methyl ester carboxylesterase
MRRAVLSVTRVAALLPAALAALAAGASTGATGGATAMTAAGSAPTTVAAPAKAAPPAEAAAPVKRLARLAPCRLEGIEEELRCGTYQVWEDREARRGRKIALNVVVLPALGPHPTPDAIVVLGGGPGEAATEAGRSLVDDKELRRHRDILLVDQRGTGKSNPLDCDLYGPDSHDKGADRRLLAGELFPPAAVRRCRDRLERVADLKLYTTALGMDDVDEVRAWLGYPQVDLFGSSFGTRAAQVFLRRHPAVVRSVVLDGVVPVDETLPLHTAYAGKRAVDLLFAECAADRACHAAFPNLAAELQAVMDRVDRGVKVRLPDPKSGDEFEVTPSRGLIAEGIRFLTYDTGARRLPLAVHLAYEGDMAQLTTIAIDRRAIIDRILAMGMAFSVTCAEDLPYIDAAAAAQANAGTLLGNYRIREQQQVCADWPRGSIPADAHQLVRSAVPALLFSGERDPVTPPEFGRRVASQLTNSLHVVFSHSGHGAEGPCARGLIDRFLERASVQGLDVSCAAKTPPPRFVVKVPVEIKLDPRLLSACAGTYALPGFYVTLVRLGDHLVARVPDSSDVELFADTQDHFFAKSEDIEMRTVRGAAGAVVEVVFKNGDEELRGKRVR